MINCLRKGDDMNTVNLVLVTGMSGAGKSTAMSILEDMGYHCIDQFPVQLVSELSKLLLSGADVRYKNVALATSALDYTKFLVYFESIGMKVKVIFLDASNEKLLQRYKYTRRNHPFIIFNRASSLEEAIEAERELFNALQARASLYHIDTTLLKHNDLKKQLEKMLSLTEKWSFSISFVSFGYKNGIPMDCDLLFDVRFLPNPYYVESLRDLTGNDASVYDYVMSFKETQLCLNKIISFLDYVLPQYQKEGKNHLTIGIGCTGGQHRSVSITNYLANYYQEQWHCLKSHRDAKDRL